MAAGPETNRNRKERRATLALARQAERRIQEDAEAERLLDTSELATMLRCTEQWLEKMRCERTPYGPPFIRIGRAIRYRRDAIERWLAQRTWPQAPKAADPPASANSSKRQRTTVTA
jgi:predicted DNA-binding transcriptional regulator AlpA